MKARQIQMSSFEFNWPKIDTICISVNFHQLSQSFDIIEYGVYHSEQKWVLPVIVPATRKYDNCYSSNEYERNELSIIWNK